MVLLTISDGLDIDKQFHAAVVQHYKKYIFHTKYFCLEQTVPPTRLTLILFFPPSRLAQCPIFQLIMWRWCSARMSF